LDSKAGLTPDEFDKLLAWLHPEREHAAERYEIIRLKLIEWFEHHGSQSGDELADVVLDRVAKRLLQGEQIRGAGYFLGVARNVFLESRSRSSTSPLSPFDELDPADSSSPEQLLLDSEDADAYRRRVASMVRCLRELPPDELRLLREYHREDARGKRETIAERLGISTAGLYTRVHRLCKRLAARLDVASPSVARVKEAALRTHKK
jgi:DNA-directed RNA polymerase specialized sigma24 family protein